MEPCVCFQHANLHSLNIDPRQWAENNTSYALVSLILASPLQPRNHFDPHVFAHSWPQQIIWLQQFSERVWVLKRDGRTQQLAPERAWGRQMEKDSHRESSAQRTSSSGDFQRGLDKALCNPIQLQSSLHALCDYMVIPCSTAAPFMTECNHFKDFGGCLDLKYLSGPGFIFFTIHLQLWTTFPCCTQILKANTRGLHWL